jgi:hypothetical protein
MVGAHEADESIPKARTLGEADAIIDGIRADVEELLDDLARVVERMAGAPDE